MPEAASRTSSQGMACSPGAVASIRSQTCCGRLCPRASTQASLSCRSENRRLRTAFVLAAIVRELEHIHVLPTVGPEQVCLREALQQVVALPPFADQQDVLALSLGEQHDPAQVGHALVDPPERPQRGAPLQPLQPDQPLRPGLVRVVPCRAYRLHAEIREVHCLGHAIHRDDATQLRPAVEQDAEQPDYWDQPVPLENIPAHPVRRLHRLARSSTRLKQVAISAPTL